MYCLCESCLHAIRKPKFGRLRNTFYIQDIAGGIDLLSCHDMGMNLNLCTLSFRVLELEFI